MNWIAQLLYELARSLSKWFLSKGVKELAWALSYATIALGLFTALLATFYQLIALVKMVVPYPAAFVLSMLPSTTGVYINTYLTALIVKRVYDYKHSVVRNAMTRGATRGL